YSSLYGSPGRPGTVGIESRTEFSPPGPPTHHGVGGPLFRSFVLDQAAEKLERLVAPADLAAVPRLLQESDPPPDLGSGCDPEGEHVSTLDERFRGLDVQPFPRDRGGEAPAGVERQVRDAGETAPAPVGLAGGEKDLPPHRVDPLQDLADRVRV